MIFNSVTYLLFLAVTLCLFWALGHRRRLWLLCISSITFYAFWRPDFALLMVFSASADYFIAKKIELCEARGMRKRWLSLSLLVNLSLLGFFKYLMFFSDAVNDVLAFAGHTFEVPHLNIILPLGISFYTFQTISYTVDVYREHIKAERDYLTYLCFVTFFPQLVAGPILRASELIHQLVAKPKWRLDNFVLGLRTIVFGLFLKVALADNVAPIVDSGFAQNAQSLGALDIITLSFLFGFQIYFDFAGYSMIAIGSALLMGIRLPFNFNFPYVAKSPREFWQRWHITLSSWIRDYLYLPLLGVKPRNSSMHGLLGDATKAAESAGSVKNLMTISPTLALFLTWAIMGLWHGANWTFVVWGLYHAVFIFLYRLVSPYTVALPLFLRSVAGWAVTLLVSMLAWVPFRAQSIEETLQLYGRLFHWENYLWLGLRENAYLVAVILLLGFLVCYAAHQMQNLWRSRAKMIWAVFDTAVFGAVLATVFVFLRPVKQFIYFQF